LYLFKIRVRTKLESRVSEAALLEN